MENVNNREFLKKTASLAPILVIGAAIVFVITFLSGCSSDDAPDNTVITSLSQRNEVDLPAEFTERPQADENAEQAEAFQTGNETVRELDLDIPFHPSESLDANGFFENIRALDYVEMLDYKAIVIPQSVHTVTEETVNREIEIMFAYYPAPRTEIYNRPVKDGDLVNIDYIGYIDNIEFAGGNSYGQGADVLAGSEQFIDDFLTQIIGHSPGDTFDVNVSFPDFYPNNPELEGKPALFVTTINYIYEESEPVLTDEFVIENLQQYYGWSTAAEAKEGIANDLRDAAVDDFLFDYLIQNVTVISVPDSLIKYRERYMSDFYIRYAEMYQLETDEFIQQFFDAPSLDWLLDEALSDTQEEAKYMLILQAIAEDAGITVTDENLTDFFTEFYEDGDYSYYVDEYGLGCVKQTVLHHLVRMYILDNAVYE